MYDLFKTANPSQNYRTAFNSDFNISFGYSRMDICYSWDWFSAEIRAVEHDVKIFSEDSSERIKTEKKLK